MNPPDLSPDMLWWRCFRPEEMDSVFEWTKEGLRGTAREFVESLQRSYKMGYGLTEKQVSAFRKFYENKGK